MKELAGRVAVVTGGSSGIGFAMASEFAAQGMKVVISGLNADSVEQAVDQLKSQGYSEILGVVADVSHYDQVEELARRTLATFERVHVLCNNAGVSILGPTWQLTTDDWRWVMDVNLFGVVHGIKAFLPIMLAQQEAGHIVNSASAAAWVNIATHAPYSASKAAIVALSQCLHSELKSESAPIGVTCLCPGMVRTQIHRSWRNRPMSHKAWSNRESESDEFKSRAANAQARGISADAVAQEVVGAIRQDRFWVVMPAHAAESVRRHVEPVLTQVSPPVVLPAEGFKSL